MNFNLLVGQKHKEDAFDSEHLQKSFFFYYLNQVYLNSRDSPAGEWERGSIVKRAVRVLRWSRWRRQTNHCVAAAWCIKKGAKNTHDHK